MNIAQERCSNHASREAVARCPECGRYFCRECIGEHEDRVDLRLCLKRLSAQACPTTPSGRLIRLAQVFAGVLLLWSSFYLLGKAATHIPSSFHAMAIQARRNRKIDEAQERRS